MPSMSSLPTEDLLACMSMAEHARQVTKGLAAAAGKEAAISTVRTAL